jgi:hypothetical protein
MSDPKANLNDPEVNSEFARSKALAKEKGTAPGVDPETGERAAVTYRQLFNETGDEKKAEEIFRDVAQKGGFGNVDLDQALDIRSLKQSVEAHKKSAATGVDFKDGSELDRFGRHHHQQAAQHQDNLVNAVGEALERLKKG